MRRPLVVLACLPLLAVACAPSISGPRDPVEQEQLTGDDAANSADARATAIAFARAYGAADPAGLAAMTALAGSPAVGGWVHWQAVQLAQFPGTVTGSVDLRSVGAAEPIAEIPGSAAVLREVTLEADVTFDYTPDDDDPFSTTRTIDAIRVAREEGAPWLVVDLRRDGLPVSAIFQSVGDTRSSDDVEVEFDSFVADPASASWQFDLIVQATAVGGRSLLPSGASLIDDEGTTIARATSASGSLIAIGPGSRVEGVVRFDALDDATGLTLHLAFSGSGGADEVAFPLEGQITPIGPAAPQG